MYSPQSNGFDYEWVEFYNPNDIAIFVNSWTIADNQQKDNIVSEENEIIRFLQKCRNLTSSSTLGKHMLITNTFFS